MNYFLLVVAICVVVVLGEMAITTLSRKLFGKEMDAGKKTLQDSDVKEEARAEDQVGGEGEGVRKPLVFQRWGRIALAGLGVALAALAIMEYGYARNQRDLEERVLQLRAQLDSLRVRYEGYRERAETDSFESDLVSLHDFVLDVLDRMVDLREAVERGDRIETDFEVRKCKVLVRVHEDVSKIKESYSIKNISDGPASSFHVFLGARVEVRDMDETGLRFKCRLGQENEWEPVCKDSVKIVDELGIGPGAGFLAQVQLPKIEVGQSADVVCEYAWPWKSPRPVCVVYYDPRLYGAIADLAIQVATKQPVKYLLTPKYDATSRSFNLFRHPEPYEIQSYGPDDPESEGIAGKWRDILDDEHGYYTYCFSVRNAAVPIAFVFKQSDQVSS